MRAGRGRWWSSCWRLGVVLLTAFVVVERRSDHAMIDLGLFRRPAFAAVTVAALATGGGIIALLSYVSGFAGIALGLPPDDHRVADAGVVRARASSRPWSRVGCRTTGPAGPGWGSRWW